MQRQLERAKSAIDRGERALQALPLRGKQAAWAATLEEKKEEVERALAYVELYGAYAECEAIYGVDHLLARWDLLSPEDQATFCFDPRVIDWSHYAPKVHLPSVVDHARVRTTPGGRTAEKREDRLRRQVLAPERHLAAFDLENTLIASNVVASYSWLATRRLPREDRIRFVVQTLREAPALLALDRRDRSDFLRHFYRRYEGADAAQLEADSVEMFSDLILTKSFPAAIRRVREHRRLGHRTLLITGALDLAIEPLRPLFDDIVVPVARAPSRRHLPRRAHRRPSDGRGPRPGDDRLRRPPTASTSPSRWPTPTRPPTCRCSRPSASPSPSTRRPGWPRWPASGAGWSSTSTSPPAATSPLLPIGPEWGRPRSRRVPKVPS